MSFSRKAAVLCALCLAIATSAAAQFGRRGGPRAPQMPTTFKPVVGSGAEYQVAMKDGNMNFTYAAVGKEQVDGSDAYWLEIRSSGGKLNGEMVMKQLLVMNGAQPEIKRMIMQPPGRPPMEMPAGMINMMRNRMQHSQAAQPDDNSAGGMGEKVGTESVTVPAGTFQCEHYRKQENGKTIDYWVSTNVPPYGLVKMTGPDTSMVLEKVLTGETSHITQEPQKMPGFGGGFPQN